MVDEPIIVTGGSVSITFNKETYPGTNGHYSASERRIVSVELVDDNTEQGQTIEAPENGKCTIIIRTAE